MLQHVLHTELHGLTVDVALRLPYEDRAHKVRPRRRKVADGRGKIYITADREAEFPHALGEVLVQEAHCLSFGATGNVVQPARGASCAIGLYGLVVAECLEVGDDLVGELEGGLSTRPDDAPTWIDGDSITDLFQSHLDSGVKLCITEATAEVASAQADEDGGLPHVHPFALQAVEYLVDKHSILFVHRRQRYDDSPSPSVPAPTITPPQADGQPSLTPRSVLSQSAPSLPSKEPYGRSPRKPTVGRIDDLR